MNTVALGTASCCETAGSNVAFSKKSSQAAGVVEHVDSWCRIGGRRVTDSDYAN